MHSWQQQLLVPLPMVVWAVDGGVVDCRTVGRIIYCEAYLLHIVLGTKVLHDNSVSQNFRNEIFTIEFK